MVWEILTAIGTLLAVFVALFLPMWQNRRRLSVQVATPGGYKQDKSVSVIIANSGGKVITVLRVLTNGDDGKIVETFPSGNDEPFPCTLHPGELIKLHYGYISEHLAEIKEVVVEDSLGKRWKCNAKSIETALAMHLEKRRMLESLYPSMQKEKGKKAKTQRRN